MVTRRLVGSTNQAESNGFSFRIAWKSMKQPFFSSKSFSCISAGPQKPQKLTSLKTKYDKVGPNISIPH